ncbi:MAG TPA: hypothetical protein VFZ48_04860 [Candidatus Saccharimonadales bacterium]
MEQQNYTQINKRINILIGVAGLAMIVGLAGLIVGLWRPASAPTHSPYGVTGPNSSYQEVITPDEGTPKRGTSNN